ncbi:GAP family protein [Camelliibacillus cellulosilyticus]|uniref:GAP family protein n=1 Tax=Camelliibacillus cellulosilyticus TaxID=2174486 RepID=A0ABV9GRL9_9BACL
MSFELLIPIGVFALLDTLSPTTLGVTVYMLLTEKERSISRIFVYLFTVALFYFIVGVMLMLGLDAVFQELSVFGESALFGNLMTLIGLGLLIGSFFAPKKPSSSPRKPKSKSMLAMVMLGFITGLIEVGTALPYFAAISMMTVAKLALNEWMPILVGYNFIMILPPLILMELHTLFKNRMQRPLKKIRETIEKRSGSTLSWVMFIAGIIILINYNKVNINF